MGTQRRHRNCRATAQLQAAIRQLRGAREHQRQQLLQPVLRRGEAVVGDVGFGDDHVRLLRLLEGDRALCRRTPVEELGIQEIETRQRLEVVDGARQHARHVVGRAVDRIKRRIADEGRIGREERLRLFDRLGLVAQPVVRPREGQRVAVLAGHIGGERARLREVGDRCIQIRLRINDGAVGHGGQSDEHLSRK